MKMVMIRHGEPDRQACIERKFIGQGYELAPLTVKGVQQAKQAAHNPLMEQAQLIVCSPYTRALQTAAEISKVTGLEICVEMDLRELEKDIEHRCETIEQMNLLHKEFLQCKGAHPQGKQCCWESVEQLTQRIVPVLEKYLEYQKIIVVTHGGVIRRFVDKEKIEYAQPYLVEVDAPIQCYGWCE